MTSNKLILFCLIVIGLGFLLLGFGFKPSDTSHPIQTPQLQLSPQPTFSEVEGTKTAEVKLEGEVALVTKVVDGDTIHVAVNGQEYIIRLLGVDTPETVDPRKPVQCFGKEASNETKRLLSGKEVILQKDISETDKYKRLLRFVYLPVEGGNYLFVNDYLIREGFAKPLTIPPDVKYAEQFLEAARQARENNRGLWGKC